GESATTLPDFRMRFLAHQAIHVGGGTTEVGDHTSEARHLIADLFHLIEDALLGTALDHASFVFGNGTEGTATEAAAHDVHRGLDHLVRGNLGIAIARMRTTLIGQVEHRIDLRRFQRQRRTVHPDFLGAMTLHEYAAVVGARFLM